MRHVLLVPLENLLCEICEEINDLDFWIVDQVLEKLDKQHVGFTFSFA